MKAQTELRRFVLTGTDEDLDKLISLMKEKSLSREDVMLILRTVKMNPSVGIPAGLNTEYGFSEDRLLDALISDIEDLEWYGLSNGELVSGAVSENEACYKAKDVYAVLNKHRANSDREEG